MEPKKRLLWALLTGGVVLAVAVVVSFSRSRPDTALSPTNIVVEVAQIRWQPAELKPTRAQLEGIESAERINEQMLRRYRERWMRLQGSPSALRSSLPPTIPGTD
jgi:hypothetical protein